MRSVSVCERKKRELLSMYFYVCVSKVMVVVGGGALRLTCVEAVLVSGAVAVKGEGGASEGAGCCCCDSSEPAPPIVTPPVPDDEPSALEKTPVEKKKTPDISGVVLNNKKRTMIVNKILFHMIKNKYNG